MSHKGKGYMLTCLLNIAAYLSFHSKILSFFFINHAFLPSFFFSLLLLSLFLSNSDKAPKLDTYNGRKTAIKLASSAKRILSSARITSWNWFQNKARTGTSQWITRIKLWPSGSDDVHDTLITATNEAGFCNFSYSASGDRANSWLPRINWPHKLRQVYRSLLWMIWRRSQV